MHVSYFLQKTGLYFHADGIVRQFTRHIKPFFFPGKDKTNILKCLLLPFKLTRLKVKLSSVTIFCVSAESSVVFT